MRKIFYSLMLTGSIGWTGWFLYHILVFPCLQGVHYSGSFIMAIVFSILTIILEERPLRTKKERDRNNYIEFYGICIILAIALLVILTYIYEINKGLL